MAYHAVVRFFAWCDRHKIGEIADIDPLHVAAHIEAQHFSTLSLSRGADRPSNLVRATIETSDIETLTPWLDFTFAKTKGDLAKAA